MITGQDSELWQRIVQRKEDLILRRIADETVLVPLKGNMADMRRIFSLNPLGARIWNMLDGHTCLGDIRDEILASCDVEKNVLDADIREFIRELTETALIKGAE